MGHVTCADCGTDELHKVSKDSVDSACFGCGRQTALQRITIADSQMRGERFRCPCGFEATLGEIQEHSRQSKYEQPCVVAEKSPQEMEVNKLKRTLVDFRQARDAADEVEDRIAFLFALKLPKPNDQLRTRKNITHQWIPMLEVKLQKLRELVAEVTEMNDEMRPTVEAIFRTDSWLLVRAADVLATPEKSVRALIYGITLEIHFKQATISGQRWLGVFLRGCIFDTRQYRRRKDSYPLKAKVTIRLHNREGFEVGRGSTISFEKGVYTSASFKDPRAENAEFVGEEKFILMEELEKPDVVVDGNLRFSFQFEPLYEF